jgi:CheY-like chemotaxis protein
LADDSVTIQKVVNLTFADEGVDVLTFGDGDSALASIRDIRPDIVLADVHMPGANGYQICEALRTADDTRNIPVILLVGSFEPFDEAEAGRVGANAYMTKPFQSIRQLVVQVNELLGPAIETPPAEEESEPSIEVEIPMIARSEKTDDIESLYQQSVTGPSDQPASNPPFELGDQGMDDEMIETSYSGGSQEPDTLIYETAEPPFEAQTSGSTNEPLAQIENSYNSYYESPDTDRVVEPSHHTAWEPEIPPAVERTTEWQPEQPPPVVREESAWETEQPPVWQAEPQPESQYHSDQSSQNTPHSEQYQSHDESTEVFRFDQHAVTEEYDSGSTEFESTGSETPSYIGQETVSFDTNELELPPQSPTFEEVELLDLPPAESGRTLELTTGERAELMGSAKQVVSLSPELMEIIVQKVVERLSQKY